MREVKSLDRNKAFRSGDGVQYSAGKANLRRSICKVKADYSRTIEDHLSSNNTRQGVEQPLRMTPHKHRS